MKFQGESLGTFLPYEVVIDAIIVDLGVIGSPEPVRIVTVKVWFLVIFDVDSVWNECFVLRLISLEFLPTVLFLFRFQSENRVRAILKLGESDFRTSVDQTVVVYTTSTCHAIRQWIHPSHVSSSQHWRVFDEPFEIIELLVITRVSWIEGIGILWTL